MNRMCLLCGFSAIAAIVAMAAGCSVNKNFVYKPNPPAAAVRQLPVKVAVLPFEDGTGRATHAEAGLYNVAKRDPAITSELWAKSLADEMSASGAFQSVKFIYSREELLEEEYYIDGTLRKAYAAMEWDKTSEFAISLRAFRRKDNRQVWEKEVTREWMALPLTIYDGCGIWMGMNQCKADRYIANINRVMQEMFEEARADLTATLAVRTGRAGADLPPERGAAPRESVEDTIERLLQSE